MTRTTLALLAALLARAASAAPTALGALPTGDVEVHADRVTYEAATGRVLLEGNTVVRRGAIVLHARSAEYDPATSEVRAAGSVLLTDPTRVISADAVRAVLGGDFEAEGVVVFVKGQKVDLAGVATVEEAGRTGRNRLKASAPHLSGTPDGHLRLTNARLTLCDCPRGASPSWEITSREADVVPGVRAILTWPVLRISPPGVEGTIPILVLPALYVPLGERQSGLLIPFVGSTGASGFTIAQPLYLTLGRSADVTLTPEYAFGPSRSKVEAGSPAIRGLGLNTELRWAPAERAAGGLALAWIDDLDAEPLGAHGQRGALDLTHGQRWDATSLQVGLHLALTDSVWVRDTNADALVQSTPYRRSDVLVSHVGDSVVGEAVTSYNQPLDPIAVGTGTPWDALGTPWGTLGASKGVSSRFGSVAADLVPVMTGPFLLSGRLGAALFGPVHAVPTENLAAAGLPATAHTDVVGRPTTTRGDARAEVSLPLLLGDAVTIAPFVRGAALGYAPEGQASSVASWGIVGATLETEVSRRFDAVRNTIAPRLEWRAGTSTLGNALGVPAYDLFDRSTVGLLSASPGPFQQLRASVETRLVTAKATLLRAELGQDVDLLAGRLAETFASLSFTLGPVTGDSGVRFFPTGRPGGTTESVPTSTALSTVIPSPLDKLSEFHAGLGVQDRRGDSLHVGFFSVGPGGSGLLLAGLDPLFDVRRGPQQPGATASAGARVALGPARLGYDATLYGRPAIVGGCSATVPERRVEALQVQQHTGTLTWESPCHCFRLVLVGTLNDCGTLGGHAMIDLGQLGGTSSVSR